MRDTKKTHSHAYERFLTDTNNTFRRVCDIAVAIDEARRVDVHIDALVDVDGSFDHGTGWRIGVIALIGRVDDASDLFVSD